MYAINQNQFVSSVEDNIGQMDLKISTLTHEVTINEEAAIKAEKELKSIISSITTEEASKQLIEVWKILSNGFYTFKSDSNLGLGRK